MVSVQGANVKLLNPQTQFVAWNTQSSSPFLSYVELNDGVLV